MAIARIIFFVAVAFLWWICDAAIADPMTDRIEIPIRQTTLSGGEIRYSILIQFEGGVIDAALDTGSTGLRVLASAVSPSSYSATRHRLAYGFASGNTLLGVVANANIAIGDARASTIVPIHLVETIRCNEKVSDCPASKASPQDRDYGLIGNDGFRAVIGTSMPSHRLSVDVPNPLIAIGGAWIVLLPLPGEPTLGKLIVNPSADELSGFTRFRAGLGENIGAGRDNPLPGCLINNGNRRNFCGPVILDTGNPQVTVITDIFSENKIWLPGTDGTLAFDDENGQRIAARFTVSAGSSPTHVRLGRFPKFGQPPPRVLAGILPYLMFSVLYDYENNVIGLKPR